MKRTLTAIAMSGIVAGCAQYYDYPVPPLEQATRDGIGALAVTMADTKAIDAIGAPSTSQSTNAGDAARDTAVGAMEVLCPPGGCSPVSLGVGLIVLIIGAPISAIAAAIGTPSEVEVDQVVADIRSAASHDAWKTQLGDAVTAGVQRRGHGIEGDASTANTVLRLVLRGPALLVNMEDALPVMLVHAELQTGDTCILDRMWRWNGAIDDFFELGADHGKILKAQLDAGTKALAKAVVDDILSPTPRVTRYRDPHVALGLQSPLMQIVPGEYQNTVASWDNDAYKLGSGVPCGGPFGPATAGGSLSPLNPG